MQLATLASAAGCMFFLDFSMGIKREFDIRDGVTTNEGVSKINLGTDFSLCSRELHGLTRIYISFLYPNGYNLSV